MLLGNYNGTPSHPVTISRGSGRPPAPGSRWLMPPAVRWPCKKARSRRPCGRDSHARGRTRPNGRCDHLRRGNRSAARGRGNARWTTTASAAVTAPGSNCPPFRRPAPSSARHGPARHFRQLQRQCDRDAMGGCEPAGDSAGLVSRAGGWRCGRARAFRRLQSRRSASGHVLPVNR